MGASISETRALAPALNTNLAQTVATTIDIYECSNCIRQHPGYENECACCVFVIVYCAPALRSARYSLLAVVVAVVDVVLSSLSSSPLSGVRRADVRIQQL